MEKMFFCPHIIHPKQPADGGAGSLWPRGGRGVNRLFSNFVLCFVPSTSLSSLDIKDQFYSSLLTTLNPKP